MSFIRPTSIIIPLYYCDESLFIPIETCFSTLQTCYPWFETIVVDDASPLPLPPHWEIAETNAVNMGYTATVNKGLSLATGDVLIVANDDIQFYPGCLDRFLTLPDNMIASPPDTASGDLESFGSIFGMTRATFELLGPLDERFKHFFSDQEYLERAKKNNVDIIKWHDLLPLGHVESATYRLLDKESLLTTDQAIFLQ